MSWLPYFRRESLTFSYMHIKLNHLSTLAIFLETLGARINNMCTGDRCDMGGVISQINGKFSGIGGDNRLTYVIVFSYLGCDQVWQDAKDVTSCFGPKSQLEGNVLMITSSYNASKNERPMRYRRVTVSHMSPMTHLDSAWLNITHLTQYDS